MRNILKTILISIVLLIFTNNCQNPSNQVKKAVYSGVDQMVEEAIANAELIASEEFKSIFDAQEEMYILVDVRTEAEHDNGYIPGSVNIPRGLLEFWIEKEAFWEDEGMYSPLKEDKIIVYCKSGKRSAFAMQTLKSMGFENVYSLDGGFNSWKENYPEEIQNNLPAVEAPQGSNIVVPESAGGC